MADMSHSKGANTARTILVVDDSPTMRKMVMACLGPSYNYVQAASGLEAIEKLALGAVDLIVLDINMPDMHGRYKPLPSSMAPVTASKAGQPSKPNSQSSPPRPNL